MTADTISVTLDPDLRRDLDEEVAGGNRSAVVAQAVDVECWCAVDTTADAAQKVLPHMRRELLIV